MLVVGLVALLLSGCTKAAESKKEEQTSEAKLQNLCDETIRIQTNGQRKNCNLKKYPHYSKNPTDKKP